MKQAIGTGHNLGDLVLFLMQLELNQKFCEHIVDSIKGDVGVKKLMLGVKCVPDVTNCPVVLCNTIHAFDDECNNGSRMHTLSGLDAQIQSMLHLLEPLGCLFKGGRWHFRRCEDLFLYCDLIDDGGRISCFVMYHTVSSAVQ